MKLLQTTFAILTLSLFAISCNKDEDTPTPEVVVAAPQNPLANFLATAGFDQRTLIYINDGDYEFGYSFIPQVNGKITAVVAKIPDVHLAMRVTIWDKATQNVLRTETIDITTANTETTKDIVPIDLTKDKEYFISFNSNDYYRHSRTDGKNTTYPITVGDLKITSYAWFSGATQIFPTANDASYYAGDLSFKFQK